MTTDAAITADQGARLAEVTTDLAWIAESWPDLHQMRLPGPRRRRPRRPLSRTARERADAQARAERAERPASVLGASRAPVHVGMLDDLSSVLLDATELADRLCQAAGRPEPAAPSTAYDFAAIAPLCHAASTALPEAAAADPDCLTAARTAAARMRRTLEKSLSEVVDGQVLSTVCAWCHGATTHHPAGGQRTLTVRLVAGDPLIVCESDVCEPSSADCGTWLFGKPAWPDAEWEWLSKRLGA